MESYQMKAVTSNDDQLVALLNNMTASVARYGILTLVILGAIGNTFNIIVLYQRKFVTSPCAVYFLTSAVIDLILTLIIALPRFLGTYNLDYSSIIGILCKMRNFVYFHFSSMSVWMTVLATVDRFFISSPLATRRQMSSFRNVYYFIVISFVLLTLVFGDMFYCADVVFKGTAVSCSTSTSKQCGLYNHIARLFTALLIPETVILICSIGILRNLKSLKVVPNMISNSNFNRNHIRKSDKELIKLMICQIVMLTISFLPLSVHRVYVLITADMPKSALQKAAEGLSDEITSMTARFANSLSFYAYLLAGTIFRQTFVQWLRCTKRRQTVMPTIANAGITRATIH